MIKELTHQVLCSTLLNSLSLWSYISESVKVV